MARATDDVDGAADDATEVTEVTETVEVTPDAETVEVELPEPTAPTVEVEPATDVEPAATATVEAPTAATPRRRFPWRRDKTAAAAPAEPVTEEVDTTAVEVETPAVQPESDASEPAEPAEEPSEADVVEDTGVEETGVEDPVIEETGTEEPEVDEPEPILVPHRTAPAGLKIATAVAAALVVLAAAFAGAMLQPYLVERANVQIKQRVAETAANAITTLWSYTPEDIDTLADRTAGYLGGDFAAQYRDFIDSIVEANKQAQVTNQTQVVGAAVESLTPTEATALVYTNSVSTTPNSQGFQSMRYVSYRLTLENRDRKWLVTRMAGITSLDLTPRL